MDFLEKKVKELTETELSDEVEKMLADSSKKLGTVAQTKESVLNAKVEKLERIRIKPANPIVKTGVLLGCKQDLPEEDLFGMSCGLKGVVEDDTREVRLTLEHPKTNSIDSLFETSKKLKRTLLVVDDYIEIVKTTTASSAISMNTSNAKKHTFYEITHYIDVLDSDQLYRIPAKTFEDNTAYIGFSPHTWSVDNLDMKEVMGRYNKCSLEDALAPLVVVS